MRGKKLIFVFWGILLTINGFAQADRFEQRYSLLVSRLGESGVGVETLIDNWEAADSLNPKVYMARFNYWLSKSRGDKVVQKYQKKYLGMAPLLSLKDSTGVDVYYFQESFYDDEGYGNAIKAIDTYDASMDVNSFFLNGLQVWLDKSTRVGLMNSLNIEKTSGKETSTLWFGNIKLDINTEAAIQMLSALELYALKCYNKTAEHKVNIENMTSVEDVVNYNFTEGYPDKLNFSI